MTWLRRLLVAWLWPEIKPRLIDDLVRGQLDSALETRVLLSERGQL